MNSIEQTLELQDIIDQSIAHTGAHTTVSIHKHPETDVYISSWVGLWFGHDLLCCVNSVEEWNAFTAFAHIYASVPTDQEMETMAALEERAANEEAPLELHENDFTSGCIF